MYEPRELEPFKIEAAPPIQDLIQFRKHASSSVRFQP
jgi:hypothetical protein